MSSSRRTTLLKATAAAAAFISPGWAPAQQAPVRPLRAPRLATALRIVIPANPGGGWDQTGRTLGAALVAAGATERVEYENIGGKGGTIGLAKYAEKYDGDADTLLMGGMVMVGAVALQRPAIDLTHVQPLARLTSDYLVATVASQSPIRNARNLADAMHANLSAVPVAGGSAGGVDHIFAGMLARAAKASPEGLIYKPFAGGAEVVQAVASGSAVLGLSGYSEFSEAIGAGRLRAIGVSSRRGLFGLASFREQGQDAVMANWRGVFTGRGVPAARATEMVAAVEAATQHESWQQALKHNRWESSWLSGKDLTEFIELDLITARVMVYLLKLKTQDRR